MGLTAVMPKAAKGGTPSVRRLYPLLFLALLAGCGSTVSETFREVGETLPSLEASPSVEASTPTPTLEPTPEPSPDPPADVEVLGIAQAGTELTVRLRNPNEDVGLVRSGFELAILDAAGSILSVEGTGGLPGASCCTIYQLPPGGEFALVVPVDGQAASVELTVLGDWEIWSELDPAIATVTDQSVQADQGFSGPVVTGRVAVDQPGPFNIWIGAYVETPAGIIVSSGFADCVTGDGPRAFEAQSFSDVRGPYTLLQVVAYPSTVEGAGDSFTPDC